MWKSRFEPDEKTVMTNAKFYSFMPRCSRLGRDVVGAVGPVTPEQLTKKFRNFWSGF